MSGRLDARTLALLAVGVVAVSLAAPLMASLAVPALAIAFWRTALAAVATAPVAAVRASRHDMRMSQESISEATPAPTATFACPVTPVAALVVAAGLCLAAHFGFWVTSLRMTSVASSTALVSLQVVWVVLLDVVRGASVGRQVLGGVLVATVGAVVVGGVDLTISARALAGDALALTGSVAMAAYAVIGGRVRQRLPTSTYTVGCYGTAAVALLVAVALAGQPLAGYASADWAKLLLLTATAQLLGHTVFNHLLATVSPTVVSLALLLEVPGAAVIAAAWLGQVPGAAAFAGLGLVLAGMTAVVVAGEPSAEEAAIP